MFYFWPFRKEINRVNSAVKWELFAKTAKTFGFFGIQTPQSTSNFSKNQTHFQKESLLSKFLQKKDGNFRVPLDN